MINDNEREREGGGGGHRDRYIDRQAYGQTFFGKHNEKERDRGIERKGEKEATIERE